MSILLGSAPLPYSRLLLTPPRPPPQQVSRPMSLTPADFLVWRHLLPSSACQNHPHLQRLDSACHFFCEAFSKFLCHVDCLSSLRTLLGKFNIPLWVVHLFYEHPWNSTWGVVRTSETTRNNSLRPQRTLGPVGESNAFNSRGWWVQGAVTPRKGPFVQSGRDPQGRFLEEAEPKPLPEGLEGWAIPGVMENGDVPKEPRETHVQSSEAPELHQ